MSAFGQKRKLSSGNCTVQVHMERHFCAQLQTINKEFGQKPNKLTKMLPMLRNIFLVSLFVVTHGAFAESFSGKQFNLGIEVIPGFLLECDTLDALTLKQLSQKLTNGHSLPG